MPHDIKPLSCNPGAIAGTYVDAYMNNLNLATASAKLATVKGA